MKRSLGTFVARWLPLEAFEVGDLVRTRGFQHDVWRPCRDSTPPPPPPCGGPEAPRRARGLWVGSRAAEQEWGLGAELVRPVRARWEWEFEVEKGHPGTISGSLPLGWGWRRGSREPGVKQASVGCCWARWSYTGGCPTAHCQSCPVLWPVWGHGGTPAARV